MLPLHPFLIEVGFLDYVEAVRASGHARLFPDLSANSFDELTQNALKRAKRLIDKYATSEAKVTFYSFRHQFRSLRKTPSCRTTSFARCRGTHPGMPASGTAEIRR